MGRKSHNLTKEQKDERNREYRMRSYWKHPDKERAAGREAYRRKRDIRSSQQIDK